MSHFGILPKTNMGTDGELTMYVLTSNSPIRRGKVALSTHVVVCVHSLEVSLISIHTVTQLMMVPCPTMMIC